MARLSTRAEFRKYILFKLGSPLLDAIPIDTIGESCTATTGTTATSGSETDTYQTTGGFTNSDCDAQLSSAFTQLDLCIDDALDYYQEFGSEKGNEKAIMYILLKEGQSVYDVPACVVTMEQPLSKGNFGSFDDEEANAAVGLFSVQGMLGPQGAFSYLEGGQVDNILTYEVAQQYNALIDLRYTLKFEVHHNEKQHTMLVFPTPDSGDDNKYMIQLCQIRVPDVHLYSDLWVQEYAVSLAMIQIGQNLSLYSGLQLADGSEFNAQHYLDRGFEERDRLKEALMNGGYGTPPAGSIMLTG